MNAKVKKVRLKKTRIALWINLPICIISMVIGIESIESMVLWKIIASAISFIISLNITILVFQQLIRLREIE